MEQKTVHKHIIQNMKTILGFSLSRLSDRHNAEDLAGEIILQIIKSAHRLKDDAKFYAFMWRIAENTYSNFIRDMKKTTFTELKESIPSHELPAQDELVLHEDVQLLRRELSLLSEQYRQSTVLYYMESLSCSQIAERLSISTEMVKYYLFRARKIIRGGIDVDRILGEKSYNPQSFEIDFWGTKAGDDAEYKAFQQRKIRGNILLTAYYSPVTAQEVSMELGVALPYLEDEINLLKKRLYLVEKSGKYLTNIPIFTMECTEEIEKKTSELAHIAAKKLVETSLKEFLIFFGSRFSNENLLRWQVVMLCSHFSLNKTASYVEQGYGPLPEAGPYRIVNGGGGRGFVWGRSCDGTTTIKRGISGIYNNALSNDGRGSVIAFNFDQIRNGQRFQMIDPIVCAAVGCFEALPDECKSWMEKDGYSINGKPNFPVYTKEEYGRISDLSKDIIEPFSALNLETCEIAGKICADHAPDHIRNTAEHIGAFVYQFNSLDHIVEELYNIGWLKPVSDTDKPAMCVIKS